MFLQFEWDSDYGCLDENKNFIFHTQGPKVRLIKVDQSGTFSWAKDFLIRHGDGMNCSCLLCAAKLCFIISKNKRLHFVGFFGADQLMKIYRCPAEALK